MLKMLKTILCMGLICSALSAQSLDHLSITVDGVNGITWGSSQAQAIELFGEPSAIIAIEQDDELLCFWGRHFALALVDEKIIGCEVHRKPWGIIKPVADRPRLNEITLEDVWLNKPFVNQLLGQLPHSHVSNPDKDDECLVQFGPLIGTLALDVRKGGDVVRLQSLILRNNATAGAAGDLTSPFALALDDFLAGSDW